MAIAIVLAGALTFVVTAQRDYVLRAQGETQMENRARAILDVMARDLRGARVRSRSRARGGSTGG